MTTTADNAETAERLGRDAVKARLAAGAEVTGPTRTFFWHLGEFGEGEEWRVALQTTKARYPELETFILANHPWSNPRLTAVELVNGSAACLEWIRQAVAAQS